MEETKLFKKVFKYSAGMRLFLTSVVPETPENHHNQKQMLESIGMEGLEWGSTTDIKMALLLVGKSNGQLTFGCPFCNMRAPYTDDSYDLYSLGDLHELHTAYCNSGSDRKKQAQFQNCVHPNLLAGELQDLIINLLNIPEL